MSASNAAMVRRHGLDAYFRSQHSSLARRICSMSQGHGPAYTSSCTKHALDVTLGLFGSVIAIPTVVALALGNKWNEPGMPAFFAQRRVGHQGPLWVLKIRSLPHAHPSVHAVQTRYGRWLRAYYLDELPQVPQVLLGQLSVVGIRVLPVDVYELLRRTWSFQRFATWQQAYRNTPLGLTGIHQVYRRRGKDDLHRFHRDLFYARRASLGLDLYLLWCTVRGLGRVAG